jgi:hypothetical protein
MISHQRSFHSSCRNLAMAAVAGLLAIVASGCGSSLSEATGTVTLDGQPLRAENGIRARVTFEPASGAGAIGVGVLDEEGVFRVATGSQQGILPGEYLVSCSVTEIIPPKDPAGTPSGRAVSDPKFANAKASGLRFKVEPGSNEFNVAVQSPSNG